MVVDGTAEHRTEEESWILNAGDLILIRPGEVHGLYQCDHLKHFNIFFEMQALHQYVPHSIEILEKIAPRNRLGNWSKINLKGSEWPNLIGLGFRIQSEILQKEVCWHEMVGNFLVQILISAMRSVSHNKSTDTMPTTIMTVLRHMEIHLYSDLTLEDLAGEAGLSVRQFCRVFSSTVGKTPHNYLLDLRCDRARNLLRNSSEPVNAISEKVGFKSSTRFIQCFKKKFGMTPGKFRNSHSIS